MFLTAEEREERLIRIHAALNDTTARVRHKSEKRGYCRACDFVGNLEMINPAFCRDCVGILNDDKRTSEEGWAERKRLRQAERLRYPKPDARGKPTAPRLTRARKRSTIDLTGDSDGDDAPPVQNELLAAHARATTERLVAVKQEVLDERERADDQGTNAMYLTAQKSELQQLVSDAARALIEADVPTHECPDDNTPFYYMLESHRDDGKQTVPWNAEAGRAMTLAEGIAWLRNNPPSNKRRRR